MCEPGQQCPQLQHQQPQQKETVSSEQNILSLKKDMEDFKQLVLKRMDGIDRIIQKQQQDEKSKLENQNQSEIQWNQ